MVRNTESGVGPVDDLDIYSCGTAEGKTIGRFFADIISAISNGNFYYLVFDNFGDPRGESKGNSNALDTIFCAHHAVGQEVCTGYGNCGTAGDCCRRRYLAWKCY